MRLSSQIVNRKRGGQRSNGGSMDPKKIIIVAIALACSACAQERTASIFSVQASQLNGPTDIEADLEMSHAGKKTLSDKMLTAIALERVTGRKPDPARLLESY